VKEKTGLKLALICAIAFFYSASIALVGQMLVPIQEYYGVSIEQSNLLLSVQSFGGIILAIVSVLYIDSMNQRKLIVYAGVLLALSLMSMALMPPFVLISMLFLVSGLAAGTINVLSNSVTIDVAKKNHQRYLTIMHLSISTGAFVMPVIAQNVYDVSGLSGAFFLTGVVMLIFGALAVIVFNREIRSGIKTGSLDIAHRMSELCKVIRIPGVKTVFFLSLTVTIWQMCAAYNISGAISSLNGDMNTGALALSLFSLGMIISRLLYTPLAGRLSEGRVLVVLNGAGAITWAIAMLVDDVVLKVVLVVLAALFCGINYPVIFGAACRLANKNTAAASGFVVLAFYASLIVFCPIVGRLCDKIGYDMGLLTLCAPLLFVIPLGLMLHKRMKHLKENR